VEVLEPVHTLRNQQVSGSIPEGGSIVLIRQPRRLPEAGFRWVQLACLCCPGGTDFISAIQARGTCEHSVEPAVLGRTVRETCLRNRVAGSLARNATSSRSRLTRSTDIPSGSNAPCHIYLTCSSRSCKLMVREVANAAWLPSPAVIQARSDPEASRTESLHSRYNTLLTRSG
jgi:hypothetical protein